MTVEITVLRFILQMIVVVEVVCLVSIQAGM